MPGKRLVVQVLLRKSGCGPGVILSRHHPGPSLGFLGPAIQEGLGVILLREAQEGRRGELGCI